MQMSLVKLHKMFVEDLLYRVRENKKCRKNSKKTQKFLFKPIALYGQMWYNNL